MKHSKLVNQFKNEMSKPKVETQSTPDKKKKYKLTTQVCKNISDWINKLEELHETNENFIVVGTTLRGLPFTSQVIVMIDEKGMAKIKNYILGNRQTKEDNIKLFNTSIYEEFYVCENENSNFNIPYKDMLIEFTSTYIGKNLNENNVVSYRYTIHPVDIKRTLGQLSKTKRQKLEYILSKLTEPKGGPNLFEIPPIMSKQELESIEMLNHYYKTKEAEKLSLSRIRETLSKSAKL